MTFTTLPTAAASSDKPAGQQAQSAYVYARISRDREGAGLGVDRQQQDCGALAERLGLTVVGEAFVDNDLSAFSGKRRPGYEQMLRDLDRPGAPRVVLAWHTDRLHRSPLELERWIELADRRGISVHTVQAGLIDLATPSGRMTARVLGAVASGESEHKAARVARKHAEIREAGRYHGGAPPFGWRYAREGRLELERHEAELVVRGMRMLLDGRSVNAVHRMFVGSAVPPRFAATWDRRSVRKALGRWANAAIMVHRGQPIGQAEWPPLSGRDTTGVEHTITADDVRAVRQILSDNAANHQTGNSPAWLLSGIATCPCGSLVRVSIGGRTGGARPIYRCRDGGPGGHISRNAAPVDEWVREVIAARLRLPDLADLLARDEDAVDVDTLRAEVATLSERLESLAILLADGTLDGPGYKTSAGRVRERLEAAQGALSASLRHSPLSPVLTAADPGDAFLAAAADVQRSVVRELCTVELRKPRVGRVPFNPDDIVITWRT